MKIPKQFIDEVTGSREHHALARAVIELGAALDLKVVAEGIETPEQIAACVPALQAWSTALTAAQKAVSSYGTSTKSSGQVQVIKDLDSSVEGRDVVIVEDIVDSGLTLSYLLRNLQARKPRSLSVCALLTKPERRENDVECRYIGFEIPNRFVIGYGLDYNERYRNLPYIGVLRKELLEQPNQ